MKIDIVTSDFDQSLFNSKAPHPLQSWEWGEARKKMGIEVVRIGQYEKDKLVNVFQMTLHPLPLSRFKIGYLPRSIWPSHQVLTHLYDLGKKHNLVFIKIEPYVKKNSKFDIRNSKLVSSSHPLFPPWTQILDLTKSEEDLFKNLHPKTRYNIKIAQKKGIIVKEISNDEGFEIFSKLYFETCKRQKYFGHTPRYHQIIWQSLKKNISHILVAFYQNTPLTAYELFNFNGVLYYPYGGSSLEYRNFMAANLIMWESIRLGRKLGAKTFDMWGSLPPQYDFRHPWAGFTRFKAGYNGTFTEMPGSYDLIINPLFYKVYNIFYWLRESYFNIRKNLV